jgi:hypothetical protein
VTVGCFGTLTRPNLPLPGLWIAIVAALLLIMAALATVGLWVPFAWLKALVVVGAALSIALMLASSTRPSSSRSALE